MSNSTSQPAIIVIFGITGDLAKRYLMPALYRLFRDDLLPEQTQIIGVSRHDVEVDDLFGTVEMCVNETDKVCDPVVMARMFSRTRTLKLDLDKTEDYRQLLVTMNQLEDDAGVCMNRLYYLSIPPDAYPNVVEHLGKAGLNTSCQHGAAMTQLLVEKPFGHDPKTAQALIEQTGKCFGENQIYRIDHYIAKETAQNILAFRFENPLFEKVWDHHHVSSIDIAASEAIGINGRAAFYERQGALRDFIQNHLLQLLAIVTMDQPKQLDSDHIHASKLRLLQAIKPVEVTRARRGQYASYRQEVANPDSHVETFAAIATTIDSPRWQDVPITIRTGKALASKQTVITLTFKNDAEQRPNVLRFRIQPDEGIQLSLLAKKPGFDNELQEVLMDFSYEENFAGPHPDAYERVLTDAVRGDQSLFTSSDEIMAAWAVVDAVVKAWDASDEGLQIYQPGTPIDELSEGL